MTFFRRLRLYLLGVVIGVIIVYFMLLHKRERPSWLPQGRILEQIASSEIRFTDKALCSMEALNVNETEVKSLISKKGSVFFSKSDTKRKPCPVYYIKGKEEKEIFVKVEMCDSISTVMWVSTENAQQQNKHCY
ncbi:hypothetical protein FLAV_01832 [Flavobacteriales bacterium]|nr:hypothetical protein [Flavobacteriales bacterium]GIK70544.1 MAG: hypothetical protein BroJett020_18390 [Bacteroidota bacterium]CAG0982258.1 hypothetical protein FLAV_01832 [Flavobacteriales bacterium]